MKLPFIKIVTINLLNDLSQWEARRTLIARDLAALSPTLIAMQEVALPENTAQQLADQLNNGLDPGSRYDVYLCAKADVYGESEGIAVLTRLPVIQHDTLDLLTQGRVAQRLDLELADSRLTFVNGHFFWQPGNSSERDKQVSRLLNWLEPQLTTSTVVVCGDFNGVPDTRAIQMMRKRFQSAYASVHGQEPDYTCPAPLKRSLWARLRTVLGFLRLLRPQYINPWWRGTLDYIFVNQQIRVIDCEVVLNRPAPNNSKIYPSDHFGLCATIEIGQ